MIEQVAQKPPEKYWLDRYIERQQKALNPGIWLRFIALQFDCMILSAPFICLRHLAAYREGLSSATQYVVECCALFLYLLVFELSPMQATPGKRLMHFQVATVGGDRLPWWRTLLRNILRSAMILPLFLKNDWELLIFPIWIANCIFSFFNPQRQMLQDWLTGSAHFRRRQQL